MADPGRSILFAEHQNAALAAEAREMSMAFADSSFLRRLTGETDPYRAWQLYFERTQPQVRYLLDGLLKAAPPEERAEAEALAGSVEAFCLPSGALESRVFANPGEATGYLIGISPTVIELSAEIAWGVHLAHPYLPEALGAGWEAAAMHAQESLVLSVSRMLRALDRPSERPISDGMLTVAMEQPDPGRETQSGPQSRDFLHAAMSFALAHELMHIRGHHLSGSAKGTRGTLFPAGVAAEQRISGEENEELAADASTFPAFFNYLLALWMWRNPNPGGSRLSRKQAAWRRGRRLTAWHSAQRASEACEAYYSAVLLLGELALRRDDGATALRLIATGRRLPFVQAYVQRTREEQLAPEYGPHLWSERDVGYRKAHHSWRIHLLEGVLPLATPCRTTKDEAWLDARLPPAPGEDPAVIDATVARHTEVIAALERELGADHVDVLSGWAGLARMRAEAGDAAGAVALLEQLVPRVEQAAGPNTVAAFRLRHNLAWIRGNAEDLPRALAGFRDLLADQRRVLGPDHPETLDTRYELVHLRRRSGDTAEATADLERLCGDFARILGPRHDDTRLAHNTLAHWQGTSDRPSASTQSPAGGHPLLSPDHPDTIHKYQARLAELDRTLGPGHPDTLSTRWFLAGLRLKTGDTAEVASECTRLLQHDLSALGIEDPDLDLLREHAARARRATRHDEGFGPVA